MRKITINWLKLASLTLLITMLILPTWSAAMEIGVERDNISGRVYDASNNQGISNLVVKLTPPRELKQPQKITVTDHDGQFKFSGLPKTRYLLEVNQGPTLLYRDVIDANQETNKNIILHSKD
jgi:hypothetical protein